MRQCYERAERLSLPVYFHGSTPASLILLEARLQENLQNFVIYGCYSSPFREMSADEERAEAQCINSSGAAARQLYIKGQVKDKSSSLGA